MTTTAIIGALSLLCVALLLWGWRQRALLRAERAYWQRRRTSAPQRELPSLFLALAAVLEAGVLLLDRNRRIAFANRTFLELVNPAQPAITGQSVISVLRDYKVDTLIRTAIDQHEPQSTTIQPMLSTQTLRVTCAPLDDDDYAALVIVRDLTQLAQLERARREMVANVSHELRTPLASIKLLVETLQTAPPPPVAQRMLGQIDDELDAITQLVDELRELSQIESGRTVLTLQPADVRGVITRALERLRQQAERRQLCLSSELPEALPPALCDPERIGQVLLNLLSNAIKFTPEGGRITVRAALVEASQAAAHTRLARELRQARLERAVLVAVEDTGIGIPAGAVDRVFERFYKVDRARTRNSGGTGLGLAIARHLVERHGGRIWAESQEGLGSTFTFLLPLADTPRAWSPRREAPPDDTEQLRVS
ncbi:sensor histidine kinase [Kallotenue papyrolyticum]|uniref:sensor histidine kinase n=1 Tax=Kallotenue papyrolyticum TaxID=1325125 RepID=UPI0004928F54|nr:ATP-binding protein [Kallotenue papyrolyticum]